MKSFYWKGIMVLMGISTPTISVFTRYSKNTQRAEVSLPEIILYLGILVVLIITIIFIGRISKYFSQLFSQLRIILKVLLSVMGITKGKDITSINESLEVVGYAYDPQQDIFYSILYPWQRNFGYCRLYDEAAAPLSMIIDCEPIYFEYDEKKWMIEFWKGQYGMTTGGEIGVYTTKRPDLNIAGVFNGTFYDCASEEDFIKMSYSLRKNGKKLFIRKGKHWWLTGFKLGKFSEPSELTMYINITLKNRGMRNAFLKGLKNAGYLENEIAVYGNSVKLVFAKPRTPQPFTRTKATDAIRQSRNKLLCDKYEKITSGCTTMQDKLKAVQEKSPKLYAHIVGLGKPKQLYAIYEIIKKYLDKN